MKSKNQSTIEASKTETCLKANVESANTASFAGDAETEPTPIQATSTEKTARAPMYLRRFVKKKNLNFPFLTPFCFFKIIFIFNTYQKILNKKRKERIFVFGLSAYGCFRSIIIARTAPTKTTAIMTPTIAGMKYMSAIDWGGAVAAGVDAGSSPTVR